MPVNKPIDSLRYFCRREEMFLLQRLRPLWTFYNDLSPVMKIEQDNLYFNLNIIKKAKKHAEEIITNLVLKAALQISISGEPGLTGSVYNDLGKRRWRFTSDNLSEPLLEIANLYSKIDIHFIPDFLMGAEAVYFARYKSGSLASFLQEFEKFGQEKVN